MKTIKSISLLLAKLVMASAYLTFDNEHTAIQRTGIKRELQWKQLSDPVPISKELTLLRKNVLYRPGEFGPLTASRQLELELECHDIGLTCQQGHSMRKQLLIKKALCNRDKLRDEDLLRRLSREFKNGRRSLLDMSREIHLPPVSIFREILYCRLERVHNQKSKYARRRIIKSMLYECDSNVMSDYLSDLEFKQMQIAKLHDIVGYAGHDAGIPKEWEDRVMDYLNKHAVNYVTEDTLRQSGSTSTPDFLILDDLHINNRPIHWIEVKSFFASGLRGNRYMAKKTIFNQVDRYSAEFGSGAVILKNGFSEAMITKLKGTLLLDGGPLSDRLLLP